MAHGGARWQVSHRQFAVDVRKFSHSSPCSSSGRNGPNQVVGSSRLMRAGALSHLRSRARAISSKSSTALKPPSGEMGPKRRWGGRSADGTQKAGIRGIGDGTRQAGAHRVTRLRVGERDPARCATLPGDCRHRFPFPSSSGTFVIGRVP